MALAARCRGILKAKNGQLARSPLTLVNGGIEIRPELYHFALLLVRLMNHPSRSHF